MDEQDLLDLLHKAFTPEQFESFQKNTPAFQTLIRILRLGAKVSLVLHELGYIHLLQESNEQFTAVALGTDGRGLNDKRFTAKTPILAIDQLLSQDDGDEWYEKESLNATGDYFFTGQPIRNLKVVKDEPTIDAPKSEGLSENTVNVSKILEYLARTVAKTTDPLCCWLDDTNLTYLIVSALPSAETLSQVLVKEPCTDLLCHLNTVNCKHDRYMYRPKHNSILNPMPEDLCCFVGAFADWYTTSPVIGQIQELPQLPMRKGPCGDIKCPIANQPHWRYELNG